MILNVFVFPLLVDVLQVSQVDLHASASQAPSSAKFKRQQSRELLYVTPSITS